MDSRLVPTSNATDLYTVAIFPLPKQLVDCGAQNYTRDDNVVKLNLTKFQQRERKYLIKRLI